MATKTLPLRKHRTFTTTVDLGLKTVESDAGWSTDDGFVVHRSHDTYGNVQYWLRIRSDHYSMHDNLTLVREAIEYRRRRQG